MLENEAGYKVRSWWLISFWISSHWRHLASLASQALHIHSLVDWLVTLSMTSYNSLFHQTWGDDAVEVETMSGGLYVIVSSPAREVLTIQTSGCLHTFRIARRFIIRVPKKATDTNIECYAQVQPHIHWHVRRVLYTGTTTYTLTRTQSATHRYIHRCTDTDTECYAMVQSQLQWHRHWELHTGMTTDTLTVSMTDRLSNPVNLTNSCSLTQLTWQTD